MLKQAGYYVLVHIITYLYVRYYTLREIFATKDDPKLIKKYPLFQRKDLDHMGLVSSFPFYITFWPRVITA
jgi:hypothetical protein